RSPNVTIGAASVAPVPLTLLIPFTGVPAVAQLLTHNAELPTSVWANVTFAQVFRITVQIPTTIHWGAPFSQFNVTVGAPSTRNGTTTVPVTLSFVDSAPFP